MSERRRTEEEEGREAVKEERKGKRLKKDKRKKEGEVEVEEEGWKEDEKT